MKTEDYLTEISRQEKQFDALYRHAGALFGLGDCAMWVMYFLASTDEVLSQQDLIGKMMFPKQTINSAVTALSDKGFIELNMIPGTRNRKSVSLTKTGRKMADRTVGRIFKAECRAVDAMGGKRMLQYIKLYREFFSCLKSEFVREGLCDE